MRFSRLLVTAIVSGLALFVGPEHVAHGATLTVNSTADTSDFSTADGVCDTDDSVGDGPCTLRAAIEQANFDAGTDTIEFSIAGAGPHTISPGSALPTIADPVIIDGTSEPDFVSTPIVELDGTSAGNVDGLYITAGGSTIKGLVINRFNGDGVYITSGGSNTIEGNYIGTNAAGTADLGNSSAGVFIDGASSNMIGGTTSGARNVISGNSLGIIIENGAAGNKVEGNYIGTDADGSAALGNSGAGVVIFNSPNNAIGGTASGARNVISGNGSYGVQIDFGAATGNKVEGNYIGTDATGSTALGNTYGVLVNAPSNTIGGTASGARNVISGNNGFGIIIENAATGTKVEGNYIGTDAAGSAALGNSDAGVYVFDAPSNAIGGTTSGARNVISGNNGSGVYIDGLGATGNKVESNYIGTNATGSTVLGNFELGVAIVSAPSNTVGGPAAGNVISGNGGSGVTILNSGATGNTITENSIYSNGGLGIDNDTGGNTGLTPPTVTGVGSASGGSDCASCTIEVFSDEDDEGETFHGMVTTAAGPCPCAWSFPGAVTGPNITATVTDGSGNTSEFSAPLVVPDTDGDGQLDPVDACPTTFTPWVTPSGDVECDGYVTGDANSGEVFIGTDPDDACADTTTWYDERGPAFGEPLSPWPPDVTDDGRVSLSDFLAFAPSFLKFDPDPAYDPRFDWNASGGVTLSDALSIAPYFNKVCDDYFNPLP